jgi:hypothetical protein
MQQPQVTVYADIGEVRTETRAAECNQLVGLGAHYARGAQEAIGQHLNR